MTTRCEWSQRPFRETKAKKKQHKETNKNKWLINSGEGWHSGWGQYFSGFWGI